MEHRASVCMPEMEATFLGCFQTRQLPYLVHIFHAWAACSGAAVWFEYVMSSANPADEPSRELWLAAHEWRLDAGPVSRPAACMQPPLQRLSDPASWAREAAAVVP